MSARPIIVIGDKTTHGGTIIQGSQTMTAGGKSIARQGDLVTCPKCKGNFPIAEGSSKMSANGRGVALEGMKTTCGAELIASQSMMKAEE